MLRAVWILIVCSLLVVACGDDEDSSPNLPPANNMNNANNTNNVNNTNNTNSATNNTNNATNNATNNGTNNATNNANNANNQNNGMCMVLNPSIGECDPLCQTGCMDEDSCIGRQEDAEVNEFTSSCVAAGNGMQGDACATDEECSAGFMCIALDGGESQCRQYCRPGSDVAPQCPMGFTCRAFQLELRVGVCDQPIDECQPIPDSCSEQENCYDTPNGKRCAAFDADAMPGDACTNSTDCPDGYRCVGESGENEICRRLCDPNDVDTCDPGSSCRSLVDEDGDPLDWGGCFMD